MTLQQLTKFTNIHVKNNRTVCEILRKLLISPGKYNTTVFSCIQSLHNAELEQAYMREWLMNAYIRQRKLNLKDE